MKSLFRYINNGQHFKAMNGDELIKRANRDDQTTFCNEESKTAHLNAIVPGVTRDEADRTQFVHFCPLDYVIVD